MCVSLGLLEERGSGGNLRSGLVIALGWCLRGILSISLIYNNQSFNPNCVYLSTNYTKPSNTITYIQHNQYQSV